jgi:hypothetical protein
MGLLRAPKKLPYAKVGTPDNQFGLWPRPRSEVPKISDFLLIVHPPRAMVKAFHPQPL